MTGDLELTSMTNQKNLNMSLVMWTHLFFHLKEQHMMPQRCSMRELQRPERVTHIFVKLETRLKLAKVRDEWPLKLTIVCCRWRSQVLISSSCLPGQRSELFLALTSDCEVTVTLFPSALTIFEESHKDRKTHTFV